MTTISHLADELLRVLLAHEEGLTDDALRVQYGARYESLPTAINELLGVNRVQLFTQGNSLLYKAIKEETAQKFEGLGPEQILVFQAIERSGNKGIWTRDIKIATNIPQHSLTKTLKILEQRSLIKSVRSVVSKSKKLYMLYDIVPAKEITGGPWYSDQEFDHEFVEELGNFIVQVVKNVGMADLSVIADKVRISGISKIELSTEELELVVNTLVYDFRLEEIQSSVLLVTGYSASKKMYKACKPLYTGSRSAMDYLTETPCGVCPVIQHCSPGGIISPNNCQYYAQWLSTKSHVESKSGSEMMLNW